MFDFDVRSGGGGDHDDGLSAAGGGPRARRRPDWSTEPLSNLPRRPPVVVPPSFSLGETFALMTERRAAAALVASHGVLLGMVNEEEVVRRLLEDSVGANKLPVCQAMAPAGETLLESDSVAYAVRKLWTVGARAMPIVEGPGTRTGTVLGVLEIQDVVAWMCGQVGAGPRIPQVRKWP